MGKEEEEEKFLQFDDDDEDGREEESLRNSERDITTAVFKNLPPSTNAPPRQQFAMARRHLSSSKSAMNSSRSFGSSDCPPKVIDAVAAIFWLRFSISLFLSFGSAGRRR